MASNSSSPDAQERSSIICQAAFKKGERHLLISGARVKL